MSNEEYLRLCRVSMCPPEQETDVDYILQNSPLFNGDSTHFVIEFGSQQTSNVVKAGQHINQDDVIAFMRGIKVKSKVKGIVRESTSRYIIGDYDTDINDFNLNFDEKSLKSQGTSDFDKINDILKENKNVISFIKDYILRFRFADFATNVIDNFNVNALLSYSSTDKIAEKYSDAADAIDEEYTNNIKNICGKDNVQTHCENNDLLSLKKEIDNERIKQFDKIIYQYNNTASYGYASGKISDFLLYPMYLEYITSDKFNYDDENPYVVELYYKISDFLKVRSKLELNNTNINGLITEFTKKCDSVLKPFWSDKERDYYGRIKEIFKYDFFTDDPNDLIKAKINDQNRVTSYSKVLDYLKNLTKYQPPVSAEEKYNGYDVNTIVNMGTQPQTNEEKYNSMLLEKLREISIMFVMLRKIEVDSNTSTDYYDEYISKDDLDNIFTIKDTLSIGLTNINEYSANTIDPKLLSYKEPLKKYLGALKSVTDNESKILRELCDRAIKWYTDNYKDIDSGEIFDKFKEVSWPSPSTIVKDGEKHDFFYIEEPKTNAELIKESKKDNKYDYNEDSLKTEYGIDSYLYWLKYCSVATLVNCMLPMYWSTGIPPPIGPIPLPIIFIPMVVIPGRVITVIGLGICGICPLPMIYFVNLGDVPGCIIPAMNIMVDLIKALSGKMMSVGEISVKNVVFGLLKSNDSAMNDINRKIEQIDKEIYNLRTGVKEDMEVKRALRKRKKLDSTSHKRKNEA